MRWALVLLLLLLPTAAAHHPGSTLGLARFGNPADVQNLVHNVVTVDLQFDEWAAEHPGLVERFSLGATEGGLPIHGLVLTDEDAVPDWSHEGKLKVYLDGSHHGNEYLSTELLMYHIEALLDRSAEPDVAQLLAHMEIHVVPILNADGNLRDTRVNFNGFDPNRNYALGHAPCMVPGLTCGGPEPFSEDEISANAAYVTDLSPDLWISAHTGVALLYYNAGEPYVPAAPDHGLFLAMEPLFEAATNGIIDMTGGPAPAVGSADDWGYSVVGTPTFTYEVHEDQFLPVYGEPIPQVLEDQLNGMRWLIDNTHRLGAWVDLDGRALRNDGLGNATDLRITWDGGSLEVAHLAPGETVALPADAAGEVAWSYDVLHVETSRERHHAAPMVAASVEDEASPWPVGLLVAALLLAARRA